jgi:hypothetical protein
MEQKDQASFEGWAIVEVFGHQRYAGYVTTAAFGQAVLFRVDVPPLEERDRVTKHYEWIEDRQLPPGATVKEAAVQGYTKYFGPGAIYAMTPCTEQVAVKAVESMQARRVTAVALPEDAGRLIAAPVTSDAEDAEDAEDDEPF